LDGLGLVGLFFLFGVVDLMIGIGLIGLFLLDLVFGVEFLFWLVFGFWGVGLSWFVWVWLV